MTNTVRETNTRNPAEMSIIHRHALPASADRLHETMVYEDWAGPNHGDAMSTTVGLV